MFDVVDDRLRVTLGAQNDAVRHVLGRQSRVVPDGGDDGDLDARKDVDRSACQRENTEQDDEQAQGNEGKGPPQGDLYDPHERVSSTSGQGSGLVYGARPTLCSRLAVMTAPQPWQPNSTFRVKTESPLSGRRITYCRNRSTVVRAAHVCPRRARRAAVENSPPPVSDRNDDPDGDDSGNGTALDWRIVPKAALAHPRTRIAPRLTCALLDRRCRRRSRSLHASAVAFPYGGSTLTKHEGNVG